MLSLALAALLALPAQEGLPSPAPFRKARLAQAEWDRIGERLPEVKAVFDAADAAFDQWAEGYAANKDALEEAWALEDAWLTGRKSAMKGCATSLRSHFQDAATAAGVRSEQDVRALAASPTGYVLLAALYRCEAGLGNDVNAAGLHALLKESATQRGPRTAATLAALTAAADIMRSRE